MRRLIRVGVFLFAGIAAFSTVQCTSATTSVTSPTTNKCQIGLTAGQSSFPSSGGQGSIGISTERDCPWNVAAEAAWISITGTRDGQGDAQVSYSVAVNPVPTPRVGSITVGPQHVELNQAAAPCTFRLSHSSDSIAYSGGKLSVGVTTLTGCGWSTSSGATWIAIDSGGSANASGTVNLSVSANSGAARTGTVTIAGQSYAVSQGAAPKSPPAPTPPPPSPAPPPPAPPPVPEPVEFDGRVNERSGTCPVVSFLVGGRHVVTSGSTEYQHGKCSDLSNGDKVHVDGVQQADGNVTAERIEFK